MCAAVQFFIVTRTVAVELCCIGNLSTLVACTVEGESLVVTAEGAAGSGDGGAPGLRAVGGHRGDRDVWQLSNYSADTCQLH